MPEKTFAIYRSSAGSGKTRTLAKEYLRLALKHRTGYFRHILAVTFTNKATQEMKDRILAYLDNFANGTSNELAAELMHELALDESTFQTRCREVQLEILHHYNGFAISTIDAFFQRVIRSFTREAGLTGDYRLEVEQDDVLEEVVNNLIDELGSNEQLTTWVVDFARESLENEQQWDIRKNLKDFAKEIFKEEFKLFEDDLAKITSKPGFFVDFRKNLQERKYKFVNFVRKKAEEGMALMDEAGLTIDDFKWGRSGSAYTWFKRVTSINAVKDFEDVGKRAVGDFNFAKNWPGKNLAKQALILKLAEEQFIPLMQEIVAYRQLNYMRSLSAEAVLNNLYAYGLVADITRKLKEYKDRNNVMLLADAPMFLNKVINNSDTPFIYEKVGSFYRNYLIDEFQDTSGLQWSNFYPLIANSLDQGNASLVVGDVKQAIYRWRGGNLKLLQRQIEQQVGKERVEVKQLNSNFRSAKVLVDFFNTLFETASQIAAVEAEISSEAYRDVVQATSREDEGFVRIQFIRETEEIPWKRAALSSMCTNLEWLQEHGVPLKDIAILVRRNDEGQQIVAHLLQYKNSADAKPGMRYDVVSNESLRIDGAASVNLLLAALAYLNNSEDAIARAQLAYEFSRISKSERTLTETFSVSRQAVFESYLPDAFTGEKTSLKKLPLYELTETLIRIFNLSDLPGELVYLQAFQDIVLNFATRERNDIAEFLTWWEENRHTDKASLKSAGNLDAVQILTIHKAKGLQFKYVMLPFCSWELDHAQFKSPTLWVTSEEDIYKAAGHVPVRYGSALKDTYFSEYYREELASSYLDNLNLLYVAFTRAEQGLIVTAPSPEIKSMKKTVSGLLHRSIQSNENLLGHWNEAEQVWERGEVQPVHIDQPAEVTDAVSLRTYPAFHWRDKLVVRHAGTFFFQTEDDEAHRKIEYGIYLHNILSGIRYRDELEVGLMKLVDSGLISRDELDIVREKLNALFENPLVASWFEPGWDVQTEVPILVPGESESRIDRLMVRDHKAVVVDFKTGIPSKADQQQVLNYIDILRKMNFTEVEGYLLYTASGEVMEVKTGKSKSRRKKDDGQLDLGL